MDLMGNDRLEVVDSVGGEKLPVVSPLLTIREEGDRSFCVCSANEFRGGEEGGAVGEGFVMAKMYNDYVTMFTI